MFKRFSWMGIKPSAIPVQCLNHLTTMKQTGSCHCVDSSVIYSWKMTAWERIRKFIYVNCGIKIKKIKDRPSYIHNWYKSTSVVSRMMFSYWLRYSLSILLYIVSRVKSLRLCDSQQNGNRFSALRSIFEEDLDNLLVEAIPVKTKIVIKYGMKIFHGKKRSLNKS